MKRLMIGAAMAAILAGGTAVAQTSKAVQPTKPVQAGKTAPTAPRAHRGHKIKPATRAEVQSHVATAFAKLDTNRDGSITREDMSALEAKRAERLEKRAERFDPSKVFDRLDSNHDGKVTKAEAEGARTQHADAKPGKPAKATATAVGGLFARGDTNKDGTITRAEFETMGQQIKTRLEQAGTARNGAGSHLFSTADTNKDGRISLTEMQQAALAQFDRADLNHDGTISAEERQQSRELRKAQRKPS